MLLLLVFLCWGCVEQKVTKILLLYSACIIALFCLCNFTLKTEAHIPASRNLNKGSRTAHLVHLKWSAAVWSAAATKHFAQILCLFLFCMQTVPKKTCIGNQRWRNLQNQFLLYAILSEAAYSKDKSGFCNDNKRNAVLCLILSKISFCCANWISQADHDTEPCLQWTCSLCVCRKKS